MRTPTVSDLQKINPLPVIKESSNLQIAIGTVALAILATVTFYGVKSLLSFASTKNDPLAGAKKFFKAKNIKLNLYLLSTLKPTSEFFDEMDLYTQSLKDKELQDKFAVIIEGKIFINLDKLNRSNEMSDHLIFDLNEHNFYYYRFESRTRRKIVVPEKDAIPFLHMLAKK